MGYFRPNIEAMTGYVPGEQLVGDYIKLNTNENPYPPSPKVLEALRSAVGESLRRYPDPMATLLREAAARLYGVSTDMVLCGNGSDDLLTIIVRAFVGESDTLVSPQPSYLLYRTLAEIQGARYRAVDFPEDYSLPPALVTTPAKVTFLANPNSPSGTFIPVSEVESLARTLSHILVIDEAYVDFASQNAMALVHKYPNVIVLRTLSKAYSLAGLRVGLAVAQPQLIAGLVKVKDSYNVDALANVAGAAALGDQAYLKECVAKILRERAYLGRELSALGLKVYSSQANFVMARLGRPRALRVQEELKQRRILVRHYDVPGVQDCLRITVGTHEQMERVLDELKKLL